MKIALAAISLLVATPGALAQSEHHCAVDARQQGEKLLRFHFDVSDGPEVGVDETIEELAPVRALKGRGKFDVLQAVGYIYRAEYRMRFLYAQFPDECVLIGQEILEIADPY